MAAFSDYPHLTKIDKFRSKSLRKTIFEVSQKLGTGVSSPVPYDTAWVARIPDINNNNPAFSESLQWLRDHQEEDGSWGAEYPVSIHSKVLNTFASILAFSQWNYKNDEDRIKRGIKALEIIAKSLPREETNKNAFEMIMLSFLEDARKFKLGLKYEQFKWYSEIGKEKLKKIGREILSNERNGYWPLLESAGSMDLELSIYRSEVTQYGLIAGQPSTTAFILRYARLRGEDFPEAEWVLKNLCAQNEGGIPHIVSLDNFEIINGLDFLLKVDINPRINSKFAGTQNAIDTLIGRLESTRGIGFSSSWPVPDDECTAIAFDILQQVACSKRNPPGSMKTKNLRNKQAKFRHASVNSDPIKSTLSSLKSGSIYKQRVILQERQSVMSKECPFINEKCMGIQNLSVYYALLRYVFTIPKHSDETLTEIEHFIGKSQNSDGGWGGKNQSSLEETAYVCLAIFRLIQTRQEVLRSIDFSKLVKFLSIVDNLSNKESFWCYKVTFGSTVLTEVILTAAKYGIFNIQRLCMFTDVLNDSKFEFLNVQFYNEKDQSLYQSIFPLLRPEGQKKDIEVCKTEIEDTCKNIFEVERLDAYTQNLLDVSLIMSYFNSDHKMSPYDRAVDTLFVMVLFMFDDYVDQLPLGENRATKIDEVMKIACKILRGDNQTFDTLPAFDLPRIEFIWRWCFHCRMMMKKNNWNAKSLPKILEEWIFKHFSLNYKLRCNGIIPTSQRYLEIAKYHLGLIETVHFSTLLLNNTVDSTEFEHDEYFLKYRDCACKAGRIFIDVPSISKDIKSSQLDNYCILLMHEFGISVTEAITKATKKCSKEIMKMYALKRMILAKENENREKLAILMKNIECFANACMMWGLNTSRYQVEQKIFTERVCHEKKDVTFTYNLCFNQN